MEISKLLPFTGVVFQGYTMTSNPAFSSSTNANDVSPALIRPNCLVMLVWRALPLMIPPQLWCQLGPLFADTAKISNFDDGGDYSSHWSQKLLLLKIETPS